MKTKVVLLGVAAVVIIGVVVVVVLLQRPSVQTMGLPLVDQKTLKALPVKNASSADVSHLESSILPPTNSWLSGMVLQKTPQPVYPMPLSFLAKDTGFEIGLPSVTSTPTVISGGHAPGMAIGLERGKSFKLSRYDKVSATLNYVDERDDPVGSLTLAEGSPFVFYQAKIDDQLTIQGVNVATVKISDSGRYLRYTKNDHDYVALVSGDGAVHVNGGVATIDLKRGNLVTFYTLPDTGTDTLKQYAGNKLENVEVQSAVTASSTETTLSYKTTNGKPTAFAAPGYRSVRSTDKALVTYDNIYGSMPVISGTTLTLDAPQVQPSNQLDIAAVSDEHRASLINSLKRDAATTSIVADDSYYAGKQLARLANLLDLAKQLQQKDTAEKISATLKTELSKRLDGSYFYYDSKLRGIAAQTAAFGSEDFNDHHFHYGYFIYAASVLGRYDASFVDEYKQKVNLLVADIAAYDNSDDFPVQRVYDPYAGHSWAAGLAPFADGNNQESSSEAMNAWNAVALWGKLINDTSLLETGTWMLSNEAQSAAKVWRSTPTKTETSGQFTSPLTSLNFSGKRTYSTFFTDESNPKLAIQLIPMNPSMTRLADDGEMIAQQLAKAIKNENYNVPLGDYSLMYLSLRDPQEAVRLAANQKDEFIDDGNSRTYLNAWLFAQSDTAR